MRRRRAIITFIIGLITLVLLAGAMPKLISEGQTSGGGDTNQVDTSKDTGDAMTALNKLAVKGKAPKTGYARTQFGNGWATVNGCDTRNIILYRDLKDTTLDNTCKVISGMLDDPYTGETIQFSKDKSTVVQIDHVVALSDAWQKGAQQLSAKQREQLANDPLELLAVSGQQNQAKSDGDAATWLPKNKAFRCEYVARQIAVKTKYLLWVTQAEKDAILTVLQSCPHQGLPQAT